MPRRTGLYVDCGSEIYVWFRGVGFVQPTVRVWLPYLRNKVWHNAAAKVDQALQVREYFNELKKM